jgi:hypothetical protein
MQAEPAATWTYSQILEELRHLKTFVVSLGVNPDVNRLDLHIDTIERLELSRQQGNFEDIDDEQTLWSMTEAVELVEIHRRLGDYDPVVLLRKVRLILKGPGVPNAEDSDSNLARNTSFELWFAAKLRQTGVFKNLSENPDVVCEANRQKVLVQCKRPLEENAITRNIRRATNQLRRDLKHENAGAKGVIAISLSRILSPKFGLFKGVSTGEVREVVSNKVDEIAQRAQVACPSDRDIIGTVFDVSIPVFTTDIERPDGRLGSVHIQCIYRHHADSSEDNQILREMFTRPGPDR